MDKMKTFKEEVQAEYHLIDAYIGCDEFLKAKAANETRRSTEINHFTAGMQYVQCEDEEGLCNYEATIAHCRKEVVGELQKQENYYVLSGTISVCSLSITSTLLLLSVDNAAESYTIFQEELDRCVDLLDKEMILFRIGTWYRKLNKWDQSIKALHQLCLSSSTRPDDTMASQAKGAMVQTCLEQYCADTTLDIDQRTGNIEILCQVKINSLRNRIISPEIHFTQAQLFYVNGDKQQAFHHLELYLDARLADCKLRCYTCNQRVRHGSVPFSCASCGSHPIVTGTSKR